MIFSVPRKNADFDVFWSLQTTKSFKIYAQAFRFALKLFVNLHVLKSAQSMFGMKGKEKDGKERKENAKEREGKIGAQAPKGTQNEPVYPKRACV